MLADFFDKHEINSLNQSIDAKQIDLLKRHLKEEIDEKQDQIHRLYLSKSNEITKIDQQTRKLIDLCEQCESKRKDLTEQIEEYSKLETQARLVNSNYHQIHHLNRFIHGLQQLIQLEHQIQECRQLCQQKNLNAAKDLFQSIENLLQDSYLFPKHLDKSFHDDFYESFQRSIRQLRSDIVQMHTILWNDGVDRQKKNEFQLKSSELNQLFQCVFSEEKTLIEKHVQTFGIFCFQNFIQRLFEKKMRLIIEEDEEKNNVLVRLEPDEQIDLNSIEHLEEIFKELKELFRVLHSNLLSRSMKIQSSKSIESIHLMNLFSSAIVNDFIEFVREHLLHRIPDDFQQAESFRSLLETVKNLEKYFIEIEFFPEKSNANSLSSAVGNLEEAIVKSRCRTYLLQSRELLQSNAMINNTTMKTILFGDDEELFQANQREKENYQEQMQNNLLSTTVNLDELDANMFRFPRTIIVEHVQQYIEFIRTVLQEAEQMKDYAAHLCATARNMMELFNVIYTSLHEKNAQEYPYLTALHFNTYMYVAHQCLILGEDFYHLKNKTADGQPITFVDFVPIFRNQAAKILKFQLDIQQDTLSSFIREIGAFHNIVNENQSRDALQRAINQCILHIRNLSDNWRSVFSSYVYFKVIAYLCDHISQLLIKETLSLEDIPEDDCQMMVNAFTQWSTFLQDLLVKDEQSPGLNILARLAPNLTRFNELCLVLNSSLQTIVDRWLNGQGPLASQFTAMEIRQLVRALFQTSDRRTAALAKIQ